MHQSALRWASGRSPCSDLEASGNNPSKQMVAHPVRAGVVSLSARPFALGDVKLRVPNESILMEGVAQGEAHA
jgi:hypothetical protein